MRHRRERQVAALLAKDQRPEEQSAERSPRTQKKKTPGVFGHVSEITLS